MSIIVLPSKEWSIHCNARMAAAQRPIVVTQCPKVFEGSSLSKADLQQKTEAAGWYWIGARHFCPDCAARLLEEYPEEPPT